MNNSQLSHNWANKVKPNGKGSNMFYENDIIYSYGYHFPIAKFFKDINGNELIAFTTRDYSNTTSKHKNHVRRSIPFGYKIIFCHDIGFCFYSHKTNIQTYLNDIKNNFQKCKKATKAKTEYLVSCKSTLARLDIYIETFGLNINDFDSAVLQSDNISYSLPIIRQEIFDFENSDEYKKWQIKQENKKIEAAQKKLVEQAENIEKFRSFQISNVYDIPYNLLRYNKDAEMIETSGGVKMPVNIFMHAYKSLKSGILKIGDTIQHYKFNGQFDNFLQIGCHRIELSEINSIINTIK
jgi:hypothetical protein